MTRETATSSLVQHLMSGGEALMAQLHAELATLVEAVAAAIDRSAEWVGELPAHEVVPLAEAALEVNADFFFTTALPLLASGVQVGARRHNGSSPGATAATSSPGTH